MAVYPERRKGRLTGKWIAEVPLHGKRQRGRFETRKEADQWEGIVKLTGELPVAVEEPSKPVGPTFGQVALEMLAADPDMDKTGGERVNYVIKAFGRDTAIAEVGTRTFDKLVADLRKRPGRKGPLSAGTINRYLSAGSSVLRYGRERGYPAGNPIIPWQEDDGHRIHWLTEEQEAAVLKLLAQHPYSAATARILVETGMRWSEFASLTASQIEPEAGWLRLWNTKNGRARSVPISSASAEELLRMVEEEQRPDYYTFREHLRTAAKSAGLPEGFSIHALRHTTATRLIHKGVALPVVQRYLGHRTIQTTMKYVHLSDTDLQDALKKIAPHAGLSAKKPQSDAA